MFRATVGGSVLFLVVLNTAQVWGEHPIGTDLYGDPLPRGAVARVGSRRFHCDTPITALLFGRENRTALTAHPDGRVRVWDTRTGREVGRFGERRVWISHLALAPDGRTLYSVSNDSQITVWDPATGKEQHRIQTPHGERIGLALSADGKRLATGSIDTGGDRIRGSFVLWDASKGRMIRRFCGHRDRVRALAFAPNGETLLSGSCDHTVSLWEVASGKERRRFHGHTDEILTVAFSSSGEIAASGGCDNSVRLWSAATGEAQHLLRHTCAVTCIAFTPDGKQLAAAEASPIVRLWDANTGRELRRFAAEPAARVTALAFSSDGRQLIAGDSQGSLHLWDPTTGEEIHPFPRHEGAPSALAFSADGRYLYSAGPSALYCWESQTGKRVRRLESDLRYFHGLAVPADASWIAVVCPECVQLRRPGTGKVLRTLAGPNENLTHVLASGDGSTVVTIAANGLVVAWDATTGKSCWSHDPCDGRQCAPNAAVSGRTIALGGNGFPIQFWNLGDKEPFQEIDRATARASKRLAFSPLGDILASGNGGTICLWEAASGEAIWHAVLGPDEAETMTFLPDGQFLATIESDGKGRAHLWNYREESRIREWSADIRRVRHPIVSPDGRWMAAREDDSAILVWRMPAWDRAPVTPAVRLSRAEMQELWQVLAGSSAANAYRAIGRFANVPEQSVPFLRQRLAEVAKRKMPPIAELIADLDSEKFVVRERAMTGLRNWGKEARPALTKLLNGHPPLEVRRRIKDLLARLDRPDSLTPARLRLLRSMVLLRRIGTPQARELLRSLPPTSIEGKHSD